MDDVSIFHREPRPTAVTRATCRMSELGQRLGELLPAVHGVVTGQSIATAAPPFMRYLVMIMEEETLELETGFALAAPFADAAPVYSRSLPGGDIAILRHVGPYHDPGSSHDRLDEWLADQVRPPGGHRREVYWTDPGEEPDPAKWRTEIIQPLVPMGRRGYGRTSGA